MILLARYHKLSFLTTLYFPIHATHSTLHAVDTVLNVTRISSIISVRSK